MDYKSITLVFILNLESKQIHECFSSKMIFDNFKAREKQKVATLATCFHDLPKLQNMFSWVFRKLENMLNIFQLEFPKSKFIC